MIDRFHILSSMFLAVATGHFDGINLLSCFAFVPMESDELADAAQLIL